MSFKEIGTPEGRREATLPFQDLPLALEWIKLFTNEIFKRLMQEKDENIEAILTELQSLCAKLPKKSRRRIKHTRIYSDNDLKTIITRRDVT
jgi:hypothetical protein